MVGVCPLARRDGIPPGGGWITLLLAVPLQVGGISLIYLGLERTPSHWVDLVLLSGIGVAIASVLISKYLRSPIVRAPLSTVSFVCTLFVFMLNDIPSPVVTDSVWGGLFRAALGLLLVGGFGAMSMSVRRLLRLDSGAKAITLIGVAVMAMALGFGRGAPADDPLPLRVYAVDHGEISLEKVDLFLEERDTGALYTRRVESRTDIPWLSSMWTYVFICVVLTLAVGIFQVCIPGALYRVFSAATLAVSMVAVVALLCAVFYVTLGDVKIEMEAMDMGRWIQDRANLELSTALSVRDANFVHGGKHTLAFGSAAASWLVLFGAIPFFLTVVSYRLRALTAPVRNPDAREEGSELATAEYLFMALALTGATLVVFVGALASDRWWGVMDAYDSRALMCLALWALSGLYFFTQAMWAEKESIPSYLVLLLGIGCVAFLVGPELGWILPSNYPP